MRKPQRSCTEGGSFIIQMVSCCHTIFIPSLLLPVQVLSLVFPLAKWKLSHLIEMVGVWRRGTMKMMHSKCICFWQAYFFKHLFLIFLWNSLLRFPTYCQFWLQLLNGMSMILSWWKSAQPTKLIKWTVVLSSSRPEHISVSHSSF